MPPEDRTHVSATPLDAADLSPAGYLPIDLDETHRIQLESWIHDHLTQIEAQMAPVLARFQEERNQLEGIMPAADYPYVGAFRVNYPITKKKCREQANRGKQAFLDSDPIWALDVGKNPKLVPYAQKIEQALDDAIRSQSQMDAISTLAQGTFESTLHGMGCISVGWLYHEDVRRNVESYQPFDGLNPQSLADLVRFEETYPNWRKERESKHLHNLLVKGTPVEREFTYTVPTRNTPILEFVPALSVRVYPEVEGYQGLYTSPCYGYVKTYTRSQMLEFLANDLIDEDAWDSVVPQAVLDEPNAREEIEPHEVAHLTIRYTLPGDERPTRYKVWFERKAKKVLRIRGYPWWDDAPDMVPMYIRQEDPGFFKRGMAWDLKDDHIVLCIILNLYLNGVDLANSMRFKAKQNSPGYYHLVSRRWSPHLPVPYKDSGDEIQPMNMAMGHLQSILEALAIMQKNSDDNTNTSALQSGRETPSDPRAPASKSLMLLQQIEPNLKEYLRSQENAYQAIGSAILWRYYQGLRLGWIDEFPGSPDLPVELLPELAKTVQPRALLFEFDRVGRAERNTTVLGLLAKFAPQNIPVALRLAIGQMDSQWARVVDQMDFNPPQPQQPPGQPGQPQNAVNKNGNGQAMGGRLGEMAAMVKGQVG